MGKPGAVPNCSVTRPALWTQTLMKAQYFSLFSTRSESHKFSLWIWADGTSETDRLELLSEVMENKAPEIYFHLTATSTQATEEASARPHGDGFKKNLICKTLSRYCIYSWFFSHHFRILAGPFLQNHIDSGTPTKSDDLIMGIVVVRVFFFVVLGLRLMIVFIQVYCWSVKEV